MFLDLRLRNYDINKFMTSQQITCVYLRTCVRSSFAFIVTTILRQLVSDIITWSVIMWSDAA